MPDFPLPLNETERLAALRAYRIIDTGPEQAYDDLVKLASVLCDMPMALITLIETDRQWFKAKLGLGGEGTPRSEAFCAHAITDTKLFVVPDAQLDPRFAENPNVTGGPRIRYYAGAPLVTPTGESLGTICVLDSVPRALTGLQEEALLALSRLVVGELELRKSANSLATALERVKQLHGLLPICAHCKRIRDVGDYWNEIESYVRQHAPVEFSHAICPSCVKEHYADYVLESASAPSGRP